MLRHTQALQSEDCDVFVEPTNVVTPDLKIALAFTAVNENSTEHLINS